jgi:F0F1-type ATP synthase epsilon subunit
VAPIRSILVDGGFLNVTPGEEETRVDVLAEYAELASEIDAAGARARAEKIRRRADEAGDAETEAELAKALMRAEHGGR